MFARPWTIRSLTDRSMLPWYSVALTWRSSSEPSTRMLPGASGAAGGFVGNAGEEEGAAMEAVTARMMRLIP